MARIFSQNFLLFRISLPMNPLSWLLLSIHRISLFLRQIQGWAALLPIVALHTHRLPILPPSSKRGHFGITMSMARFARLFLINRSLQYSRTFYIPLQDPNDLSFRAGDVVDITAQTNTDWWTGSHRGKQGLFPVSYVERLPPSASSGFAPPTAPAPYGSLLSHAGPEKVPVHSPAPSAPYPPYQPAGGYQPPPPGGAYNPYGGPAQPQSPPSNTAVANPEQPPKKSKFGGKFGSTVCLSLALL